MKKPTVLASVVMFGLLACPWCAGQASDGGVAGAAGPDKPDRPAPPLEVNVAGQPTPDHGAGTAAGSAAHEAAPVLRTWRIEGKVFSSEGESLPAATLSVASFSSPSHHLAETQANRAGAFTLELDLAAQPPNIHRLVLAASSPGYQETDELFDADGLQSFSKVVLFLRKTEESFEEPSLNLADAWVLPQLARSARCDRSPEARCRNFIGALARYRRQPTDKTALDQVLRMTLDSELPEAHPLAALALMRVRAFGYAEKALASSARRSDALPEVALLQGVLFNFLRQPGEAAKALKRVQGEKTLAGLAELELGRAAVLAEDWQTAEETLSRVVTNRKLRAQVHFLRARALFAEGYLESASREAKALMKCMGRKPLPPAVQGFVVDVQNRLEERSIQALGSVMTEPVSQLVQAVGPLKGLDSAASPPPGGLKEFLKQVGIVVDKFFYDFTNTAATEVLWQTRLDKKGKPIQTRSEEFYYVFLNRKELGRSWMEEFRSNRQGQPAGGGGLDSGYMATSGFVSSLIVLHPKWQPGIAYRYLGRQQVDGRLAYVIAFAQQPGASQPLGFFNIAQSRTAQLYLQGIAWISADLYEVLRLRTDLLKPVPGIQLNRETAEIDYRSYRFNSSPRSFWLPNRVTVSVDWSGKRLRNEHIFSRFKLFKVDTEESGFDRKVSGGSSELSPN